MSPTADPIIVNRLKQEREKRRVDELTRQVAGRISSASKKLHEARQTFELLTKDEIMGLIKTRQEILNWLVRRQTLIEVWELATGKVWDTSAFKDE